MSFRVRKPYPKLTRRNSFPIVTLALCLFGLLALWPSSLATRNIERAAAQRPVEDARRAQAEMRRKTFESGRNLLLQEKVPFEPNLLLAPNWRRNLAATFAQMPQMQAVRRGGKSLNGVQMADTLYLPEKVSLTGDTVILARYIIFEGDDVVIKGNHDIHIFPVEAAGVLGTSLQAALGDGGVRFTNASLGASASPGGSPLPGGAALAPYFVRDGTITIDTRGPGREEWLRSRRRAAAARTAAPRGLIMDAVYGRPLAAASFETDDRSGTQGADGNDGSFGFTGSDGGNGSNGQNGVCGGNINGTNGTGGAWGVDGAAGGDGTPGNNGGNGGSISGSASMGVSYHLITDGGQGGRGGNGGQGGQGGRGGNGGNGGNGADCNCVQGGSGAGGAGGAAGAGGQGGSGGNGNDGGRGGNAGSISYTYPPGYNPASITTSAVGGQGGTAGSGGGGGTGGSAGNPGQGGSGASGNSCTGSSGQNGNTGNTGVNGEFGATGSPGGIGQNGSSGSVNISEEQPGSCPSTDCNAAGSECPVDFCMYPGSGCPNNYVNTGACCQPYNPSPVLVDVDGSGFNMTGAADGVWFDFYGTGTKINVGWTAPGSTNAWLVLDRNGNGSVDSAREMFGNITAQPPSADANGFLALAEFDKTGAGGNGNGVIEQGDSVFASLRLWQDANHNAVSEPEELHTLASLGVSRIELDYKESRRTDQFGNQFRYRAKVRDARGAQVGRWAWDVFLTRAQ